MKNKYKENFRDHMAKKVIKQGRSSRPAGILKWTFNWFLIHSAKQSCGPHLLNDIVNIVTEINITNHTHMSTMYKL